MKRSLYAVAEIIAITAMTIGASRTLEAFVEGIKFSDAELMGNTIIVIIAYLYAKAVGTEE